MRAASQHSVSAKHSACQHNAVWRALHCPSAVDNRHQRLCWDMCKVMSAQVAAVACGHISSGSSSASTNGSSKRFACHMRCAQAQACVSDHLLRCCSSSNSSSGRCAFGPGESKIPSSSACARKAAIGSSCATRAGMRRCYPWLDDHHGHL